MSLGGGRAEMLKYLWGLKLGTQPVPLNPLHSSQMRNFWKAEFA